MTDCEKAEVRDLLPDLVHGRLDAVARGAVERHVRECAECGAEVALLRELRSALHSSPPVDVAAIVAAVPGYRTQGGRSWIGWRAAAAITVLLAGGSSVAVLQRSRPSLAEPVRVVQAEPQAAAAAGTGTASPIRSPVTTPSGAATSVVAAMPAAPAPALQGTTGAPRDPGARELVVGGGSLGDLDDRELALLLRDIESLDGLPTVEVENAALAPIAPGASRRRVP